MSNDDSVAPDQLVHPRSLIWKLHCPLICRIWLQTHNYWNRYIHNNVETLVARLSTCVIVLVTKYEPLKRQVKYHIRTVLLKISLRTRAIWLKSYTVRLSVYRDFFDLLANSIALMSDWADAFMIVTNSFVHTSSYLDCMYSFIIMMYAFLHSYLSSLNSLYIHFPKLIMQLPIYFDRHAKRSLRSSPFHMFMCFECTLW